MKDNYESMCSYYLSKRWQFTRKAHVEAGLLGDGGARNLWGQEEPVQNFSNGKAKLGHAINQSLW